MNRFWCLLPLSILLFGCSSVDCPVQNTVATRYSVMDAEGNALKLTDSLTVTSTRKDGTDTTLLNRGIDISEFALPISQQHPEDVLLFSFVGQDTVRVDTVWVKKRDIPHFESVDCAASFFHELEDVSYTRHAIDSIVMMNRTVNYDQKKVHFCLYPKADD